MAALATAYFHDGFSGSFGVILLFSKILLKRTARQLAGSDFDTSDAMAWFGVDLTVLSFSMWISLRIQVRAHLTYEDTIWAYAMLVGGVLATAFCYNRFWINRTASSASMLDELVRTSWTACGLVLGFTALTMTFGYL
jgi:hypothetical protein